MINFFIFNILFLSERSIVLQIYNFFYTNIFSWPCTKGDDGVGVPWEEGIMGLPAARNLGKSYITVNG